MQKISEVQFNKNLKMIAATGEKMAAAIHVSGLFAIAQANEHGNVGFGARLIEAMGRKHDRQRVVNWLVKFGKFGVTKGEIVYRKRKDIGPENLEAMLEAADKTPYWELTPQKPLVEKVDYLAMLRSIVKKAETNAKRIEAGEGNIDESNVGVIVEVKALLEKHDKAREVKPVGGHVGTELVTA